MSRGARRWTGRIVRDDWTNTAGNGLTKLIAWIVCNVTEGIR
jgi:hypothetical protein